VLANAPYALSYLPVSPLINFELAGYRLFFVAAGRAHDGLMPVF
jgi:hypothetical protein